MTLTFNLKRSSTKSKRTHKKFPRQKLKNDFTTARNLKEWAYCKHNWLDDDDYTCFEGNLFKFLKSNENKPINKVYSKFLRRCRNLHMYSPMEEFYSFINKEEDIDIRIGGFYISDGILKYKNKKFIWDNSSTKRRLNNEYNYHNSGIDAKLKALVELKIPQCLGRFILHSFGEKTIYMDYYPEDYELQRMMPYKYHNVACYIPAVGSGINYDIINTQTGKTKILYYLSTRDKPNIYFYYKE